MILKVGDKLRVKRDFGTQGDFKQGDLAVVTEADVTYDVKGTVIHSSYTVEIMYPGRSRLMQARGDWDFLSQVFELVDAGPTSVQPKMPLPKCLESWYKEVSKELPRGERFAWENSSRTRS